MSYYHLTIKERIKIETYVELGLNLSQIAAKIGVHRSTISRELNPCPKQYSAERAQKSYEDLAKQKRRKIVCTPELQKEIETGLKASWSPEQIQGRFKLENRHIMAFKTIYNWIYSGVIQVELATLRRKGKSRQVPETRGKFTINEEIGRASCRERV